MVRRLPRRWRRGRRHGRGAHAPPAAQLHGRHLQDPHDGLRPAADRRGPDASDRRRAARQRDAGLEGAVVGRRATRRGGVHQDVLVVFRGHEPARGAAQVLGRAERRDRGERPQDGAAVLRLHRVPQVSWRPGTGGRAVRAHAQGRRRLPHFCGGPASELAVSRRGQRGGHLPAAAHRARRDADALVLGPDRPEIPDRRAAVAPGPVRALALAARAARGARRHSCPADRRHRAGFAGRLRVAASEPLLVPARRPGDP